MEDRRLSVDEITEYLGVGRDSTCNRIATRAMPAHSVGRRWKPRKDEVQARVGVGGTGSDARTIEEQRGSVGVGARGTRRTRGAPLGSAGA